MKCIQEIKNVKATVRKMDKIKMHQVATMFTKVGSSMHLSFAERLNKGQAQIDKTTTIVSDKNNFVERILLIKPIITDRFIFDLVQP